MIGQLAKIALYAAGLLGPKDAACPFVMVRQPGHSLITQHSEVPANRDITMLQEIVAGRLGTEAKYTGTYLDSVSLTPVLEFEASMSFNPEFISSGCDAIGIVGKFAAGYEDVAIPPPPPSESQNYDVK